MHIITKRFTFEAAHRLLDHPKCGRLHGHSYVVEVELRAAELAAGMVVDYAHLAPIKKFIDDALDHKYIVSRELVDARDPYQEASDGSDLCLIMTIERSTAEHMARWLFDRFKGMYPELSAVTVCETANTTATYRLERGLR